MFVEAQGKHIDEAFFSLTNGLKLCNFCSRACQKTSKNHGCLAKSGSETMGTGPWQGLRPMIWRLDPIP